MQWNDDLTMLKNELAIIYATKDDSYPVVREAGLRSGTIAFKDKADNNWSEIINEALRQKKVLDIIRVALRNYPDNEVLQRASFVLARQFTTYSHSIGVFYFYAPEDAEQHNDLTMQLSTLLQNKMIEEVYDRAMSAEDEWAERIMTYVDAARIFLILISPQFMVNYSQRLIVKRALERHLAGDAYIIPILLYPTDLKDSSFSNFKYLPKNGKPIMAWQTPSLAYEDIVMDIHKFILELNIKSQNPIIDNEFQKYSSREESRQIPLLHTESDATRGLQTSFLISNKVNELRSYQKKVSILKGVHNMLHEVEWVLIGLSATIQLQLKFQEGQENKAVSTSWFPRRREIKPSTINFRTVEVFWQQVFPKIDDLRLFADEKMAMISEKPFSFDDTLIRGPKWVTELVKLQRDFEASIEEQNIAAIDNLSNQLLTSCRKHLYTIDKLLRSAIEELERVSDQISRYFP